MSGFGNRGASAGAIQQHYDLGNDFYAAWLGTTMAYSAARWLSDEGPDALDTAQERKLDWHLAAAKAQGAARVSAAAGAPSSRGCATVPAWRSRSASP
jgi:cyclopropane fatty-acyl-phospholipid synthase-like methyltransferase